MSRAPGDADADAGAGLPRAVLRLQRWSFPVVWVVPLVAALVAGYLLQSRMMKYGPTISIMFKDAAGLRSGQTAIKYRGVLIGEVTAVVLSNDREHVLATVRLTRAATSLAQDGATFWIVRPEVALGNITGLSTVMTGPEIQMLPGAGKPRYQFVGLESAPSELEPRGLEITLHCTRLGSLRPGSLVYFRGIEVGAVQSAQLSVDAAAVDVRVVIRQRYVSLVHTNSRFWRIGGVQVSGGIFQGVNVKLESLSSLITGGIAFATPDSANANAARNGTTFTLYDDSQNEWLAWAPRLRVRSER